MMLSLKTFVLILASVSLSALAQISLKHGMSSDLVRDALARNSGWLMTYVHILKNPYVFFGLAAYGFGALMWLLVLSRLPVSTAYPFVGLGFILTMLLGATLLGEHVGVTRAVGTLFVVVGVMLVARTNA